MQRRALLKQSLIATLLLSAATAAFAGGGGSNGSGRNQYPHPSSAPGLQTVVQPAASAANADWAPKPNGSAVIGTTRAQVRAELLQAEETGLIPTLNAEYPPSADTIARNRAHFQQTELAWRTNNVSGIAAR
jgi:hypothetical protein